jgi:hypothetical protein
MVHLLVHRCPPGCLLRPSLRELRFKTVNVLTLIILLAHCRHSKGPQPTSNGGNLVAVATGIVANETSSPTNHAPTCS